MNPEISYDSVVSVGSLQYTADDSSKSFKEFMRWKNRWVKHLDANRSTRTYLDNIKHHFLNDVICSNQSNPNWSIIGPIENMEDEIYPFSLGRVHSIWVNPVNNDHLRVGCYPTGLFQSTDGGRTWQDMLPNHRYAGLAVEEILVNPMNTQEIYVCAAYEGYSLGIIRTTNGGVTWGATELTRPTGQFGIELIARRMKCVPNLFGHMYAITAKRLYYTSSAFLSSKNLLLEVSPSSDTLFDDLDICGADTNVIYISGNNSLIKVLRSTNVATDLTPNLNIPTGEVIKSIRVSLNHDSANVIYALVNHIGTYQGAAPHISLFKSSNQGLNFSLLKQANDQFFGEFEISKTQDDLFYYGSTVEGRFWKENGTWHHWKAPGYGYNVHPDIREIRVVDSNGVDHVFLGHDGGITKYDHSKNEYFDFNGKGLNIANTIDIASNDFYGYLFAGFEHDYTNVFDYNTRSWRTILGGDGGSFVIKESHPSLALGTVNGCTKEIKDFFVPTSGGGSPPLGVSCGVNYNYLQHPMSDDHLDTNKFFVGYNGVYHYDIQSDQWTELFGPGNGFSGSTLIEMKTVKNTSPSITYFSNSRGLQDDTTLFKMTGTSSVQVIHPPTSVANSPDQVSAIEVDHNDPDRIWFGKAGIQGSYYNETNKVFQSTDAGVNWVDISNGLPDYTIFDLMLDNSRDILYAGTSIGVWYRDLKVNTTSQEWVCYNNSLPASEVYKLDINECRQTLIAGTYGRGVFEVDLVDAELHSDTISIVQDTTIHHDWNCASSILVSNSSTLTIKSTLRLSKDVSIIVEPGSRLFVDGGTITNSCGALWNGIVTWGDSNLTSAYDYKPFYSQYLTSKHGLIELKDARIEHAKTAVSLGKIGANQGGILYASNTKFVDNTRAVQFLKYQNYLTVPPYSPQKNISKLINCSFLTTPKASEIYPEPFAQITMWQVDGVKIKACTFADSTDWESPQRSWNDHARMGIYSVDAIYNLDPICYSSGGPLNPMAANPCLTNPNADSNIFMGYSDAIMATCTNPIYPVSIRGVKFVDNYRGVRLVGTDFAEVYRNDFHVLDHVNAAGLYADGSTGFYIEANNFYGPGGVTVNGPTGLVVRNSKDDENTVTNNYMETLRSAASLWDDNDGPGEYDGLQYLCNEMASNHFDIRIQGGISAPNDIDIGNHQGYCDDQFANNSRPAMNVLQTSCSGERQIKVNKNSNQQVVYHYFPNVAFASQEPICYTTTKVTPDQCLNFSGDTSALCILDSKSTPSAYKLEISGDELTIDVALDDIETSDDSLQARIINDDPDHVIVTHFKTLAPYITDATVLESFQSKPTPMADSNLLKALKYVAPLNPSVHAALQSSRSQVAEDLNSYVFSEGLNTSPHTNLFLSINAFERHIKKMREEIVRYWLIYDTTGVGTDSVLALFTEQTDGLSRMREARLRMHLGQFSHADSIILSYQDSGAYYANMQVWRHIMLGVLQDSSDVYSILNDSSRYADALLLAGQANPDVAAANAQALLALVSDSAVSAPMYDESEGSSSKRDEGSDAFFEGFKEEGTDLLLLYPNPTSGEVAVEYLLPDATHKAELVVYSSDGKLQDRFILKNTQGTLRLSVLDYAKGIYVYIINADGKLIARRKLSVLR